MNGFTITAISLGAFALLCFVLGTLILKGVIKVPVEKKETYVRRSFGGALIALGLAIVSFIYPPLRRKVEERKKTAPIRQPAR